VKNTHREPSNHIKQCEKNTLLDGMISKATEAART